MFFNPNNFRKFPYERYRSNLLPSAARIGSLENYKNAECPNDQTKKRGECMAAGELPNMHSPVVGTSHC